MNWSNLKNGLCPKCGEKLVMGIFDEIYPCSKCDFRIWSEKWKELATPKMYKHHAQDIDNLSALNNLGHDLVTEDFSDSPYKT